MTLCRRLPVAAWCVALACAAAMTWIAAESDDGSHAFLFSGQKGDYYSLLVAGFRHGHLYLNTEADPGLASSDPYVRAHTPTLLDANYYKGHFYLYYGVVPAALLLLPYNLLTGQDLGINIACLAFWLLGFSASLAWLRAWWRDSEAKGGAFLAAVLVALLAFFPATTFLVRRSMFYELPLVAGYAFLCVLFAALYEVARGRRVMAMVALASAGAGLAVGCHPNHILLLPLVAWGALQAARGQAGARQNPWRLALAAVLPAAAIGAGLAWYNTARFGDPFEFGFRYGQNGFFAVKQSLFVPRFLWANFKWYFLTPPAFTPYFPFVFPGNNTFRPAGYEGAEAMHGQFLATLALVWTLVGLLVARRGGAGGTVRRLALSLCYAALVAFLFMGGLQIRANRYMVDFETPLAWIMALCGGTAWMALGPGLFSRLWKGVFAGLVLTGCLFFILASLQQFDQFRNTRPASFAALSKALNIPYAWFYRAGVPEPGLLSMTVRFAPQKDPVIEPLVTTGTPGYSDSVYVAQYPNRLVQFSFNHKGYGGPIGGLIPIDLDRDHTIEISMGSFYPPMADAYIGRFNEHSARILKRLAYLRLDGKVVMSAMMPFYESPPWAVERGSNTVTLTEFRKTFSGSLLESHVASLTSLLVQLESTSGTGILRYRIEFPPTQPLSALPLLGAGVQGDGNLVLAKAEGGTTYRIEMDDWGYAVLKGGTFNAAPGEHDLEIILGPVLARGAVPAVARQAGDLSALKDRIVVCVDGVVLGNFPVTHHRGRIDALTPAANPQGFSTAQPEFGGSFEAFPMMDSEVEDLLARALEASRH
jgi:hypothetical protein